MACVHLSILAAQASPMFARSGRDFIIATNTLLANKSRGSCVGVATENEIKCELTAEDLDRVENLVTAYGNALQRAGVEHRLVMRRAEQSVVNESLRQDSVQLLAVPFVLTRRVFDRLPAGSYLVSNIMTDFGAPIFCEPVALKAERRAQWERIRAVGCDQRLCRLFSDWLQAERWRRELVALHPRQ